MEKELTKILHNYEKANNSHDWSNVKPFIHENASFFFTDGTFNGIEEIKEAVSSTFDRIQNEVYKISNVKWVLVNSNEAVCTYDFNWTGVIDGKVSSGSGRGTNVWIRVEGNFKIIHEHLSK